MPNWCENKVYVYGPTEDVDAFFNKCYDNVSRDFQMLEMHLPTPESTVDESGNETSAWYQWRIDNWGSKWEFKIGRLLQYEGDTNTGMTTLGFYGDTPWGPPLFGLESISAMYPKLMFYIEYEEPGMGFAGYSQFVNGEEVEGQQVDTYKRLDTFLENIEYEYEVYVPNKKDETNV